MTSPITQPIASAKKSRTLPNLLMKRCFCNNSVMPPYEILNTSDTTYITHLYLLSLTTISFLYPYKNRKDKIPKTNKCMILSGPSQSQNVTTAGK